MRDPARIDEMLTLLKEYWHAHPDTRFGQLAVILALGKDPFYMEDDAALARLQELLEQG